MAFAVVPGPDLDPRTCATIYRGGSSIEIIAAARTGLLVATDPMPFRLRMSFTPPRSQQSSQALGVVSRATIPALLSEAWAA